MALPTAVQTALAQSPFHAEHFVEILFPDSFVLRLWTGTYIYPLSFDGGLTHTDYHPTGITGAGGLGTIADIPETSDMSAQPLVMTLAGLPTSLLAELRNYQHQGAPVNVYEALFNANNAMIATAYNIYVGLVDTMSLVASETLTISLNVNGLLQMIFRGPDGRRRTQADQDSIFGLGVDLGFEYAAQLKGDIPWGLPSDGLSKHATNV